MNGDPNLFHNDFLKGSIESPFPNRKENELQLSTVSVLPANELVQSIASSNMPLFIGASLPQKKYKADTKEQMPASWQKKQLAVHQQHSGGVICLNCAKSGYINVPIPIGGMKNSPVDIRALARLEVEQLNQIEKGGNLRQPYESLGSLN